MTYEQISFDDLCLEQFENNKKLRLISCFSGYDSQAESLNILNIPFEHYRTCEWAVKSIQALYDLHFSDNKKDYSANLSFDEVTDYLYKIGISNNYNDPMQLKEIKRFGENKCRTIYNQIKAEHNLVNIMQVKGETLGITDTDKYNYLITYSFPCQDLSLAGKRKGMTTSQANGGTRSGLLWEIERILNECNDLGNLPQLLLLENVSELISSKNIKDFQKWELKLESLGYKNYVEILNAKDFGIPQNRRRCFMISILGDYNYKFPKKMKLKYHLKDLLEDNVDEKYYLSDKQVNSSLLWKAQQNPYESLGKEISPTLTTRTGAFAAGMILTTNKKIEEEKELKEKIIDYQNKAVKETIESKDLDDGDFLDFYNRNVNKNGVAGVITTRIDASTTSGVVVEDDCLLIPNATKKGYLEAKEGDGIDLESFGRKGRRGTVQKGKSQTIKTQNTLGVVVDLKRGYSVEVQKEKEDCIGVVVNDNIEMPKVIGGIGEKKSNGGTQYYQQDRIYYGDIALTLPANLLNGSYNYLMSNLRIRKLTPKECFRLMGIADCKYNLISKHQSNSSLYHLAGDSIVTTCLCAILGSLFNLDYQSIIKQYIEENIIQNKKRDFQRKI